MLFQGVGGLAHGGLVIVGVGAESGRGPMGVLQPLVPQLLAVVHRPLERLPLLAEPVRIARLVGRPFEQLQDLFQQGHDPGETHRRLSPVVFDHRRQPRVDLAGQGPAVLPDLLRPIPLVARRIGVAPQARQLLPHLVPHLDRVLLRVHALGERDQLVVILVDVLVDVGDLQAGVDLLGQPVADLPMGLAPLLALPVALEEPAVEEEAVAVGVQDVGQLRDAAGVHQGHHLRRELVLGPVDQPPGREDQLAHPRAREGGLPAVGVGLQGAAIRFFQAVGVGDGAPQILLPVDSHALDPSRHGPGAEVEEEDLADRPVAVGEVGEVLVRRVDPGEEDVALVEAEQLDGERLRLPARVEGVDEVVVELLQGGVAVGRDLGVVLALLDRAEAAGEDQKSLEARRLVMAELILEVGSEIEEHP